MARGRDLFNPIKLPADETEYLDDPQKIGEPETHVGEFIERRDLVDSDVGDDGLKAQFPGFDEELLRTESQISPSPVFGKGEHIFQECLSGFEFKKKALVMLPDDRIVLGRDEPLDIGDLTFGFDAVEHRETQVIEIESRQKFLAVFFFER